MFFKSKRILFKEKYQAAFLDYLENYQGEIKQLMAFIQDKPLILEIFDSIDKIASSYKILYVEVRVHCVSVRYNNNYEFKELEISNKQKFSIDEIYAVTCLIYQKYSSNVKEIKIHDVPDGGYEGVNGNFKYFRDEAKKLFHEKYNNFYNFRPEYPTNTSSICGESLSYWYNDIPVQYGKIIFNTDDSSYKFSKNRNWE